VFAFRLLHYLFEYVLNSQAGTQKANSIAVHQLEQVAAGPIDTSDAFQVNFDLSARLIRTGNLPAVFELGHIDPGYPPLDLEYQLIVDFFHLNFHHWFTDIACVPWTTPPPSAVHARMGKSSSRANRKSRRSD
jgi:hypothetical protein